MSDEYVRKDLHNEQIEHLKDAFAIAVQDLDKRIDDLNDSYNRGLAVISSVFVIIQIGIAFLLYYLH